MLADPPRKLRKRFELPSPSVSRQMRIPCVTRNFAFDSGRSQSRRVAKLKYFLPTVSIGESPVLVLSLLAAHSYRIERPIVRSLPDGIERLFFQTGCVLSYNDRSRAIMHTIAN